MNLLTGAFEAATLFAHSFSALLAQSQQSAATTWLDVLRDMDNGKLAVLLIFGTGFVSAVGYAISSMIRAYHASPDDTAELTSQIATLEKRMIELERQRDASMV